MRAGKPGAWLCALWLTASSACATGALVRPAGTGTAIADASDAWSEASRGCAAIRQVQGTYRLSGRVGRRFSGVRLDVVADRQGRLAMDAVVLGPPIFSLAGETDAAVLLLRQQGDVTVVRGPAADIVEALIGVRLGPERLLAILSGCLSVNQEIRDAASFGSVSRIALADGTAAFLERRGRWLVRAGDFDGVSIDYVRAADGRVRQVLIRSSHSAAAVSLTLRVADVTVDGDVSASVFSLTVPPDAVPMSVADLRATGPLRGEGK